MITNEEVLTSIMPEHDAIVREQAPVNRAYRDAYSDNFWGGVTRGIAGDGTARGARSLLAGYPIKLQVNHVRTWVHSYVDSLFHKKLRAAVRNPITPREPNVVLTMQGSDENPVSASEVVAALLDDWLDQSSIEDQTQRAAIMGLLYPECAFKVGSYDDPSLTVAQNVWLDVLPPWECVWDRKARSFEQLRYVGHAYWMPKEEFLEKYDGFTEDDLDPKHVPDVLEGDSNLSDLNGQTIAAANQSFIRVLEFIDLTAKHKLGSGEVSGEYRVYVLEGLKPHIRRQNEPIVVEATPYDRPGGNPLVHIVPLVLMPLPEYPLKGTAPVAGAYELNAEENFIQTFLVNAARRDAARKLLTRKEAFTEEEFTKLVSGVDMEIVEIEDEIDPATAASWLQQQPVSTTLLTVLNGLRAAREQTSSLSPLSRGEAIKYATAAEVHSLNQYSETTLGRIRRALDVVVVRLLSVVVRVTQAVIDRLGAQGVPLLVDGQEVVFLPEYADEDWRIAVADAQSTPMDEMQKRQDLQLIMPALLELSPLVQQGDAMATAVLRHMVDIYDLPDDFSPEVIKSKPTPPPPAPAPAPGGPSPEEALLAAAGGQQPMPPEGVM